MDKSWIDLQNRASDVYIEGVDKFLDYAYQNNPSDFETRIYCPCKKCTNRYLVERAVAREHMIIHGFLKKYKTWSFHGEPCHSQNYSEDCSTNHHLNVRDDMIGMIHEAVGIPTIDACLHEDPPTSNSPINDFTEEDVKFRKLIEDAQCPLYPDCTKYTSLSFMVRLLQGKTMHGWTDVSFTWLLESLIDAFPNIKLPRSYYEAQKITKDLGFSYETWDACPNNCMLFRGNDILLDNCEICGESRYKKLNESSSNVGNTATKIASKQVRYFPIKPRLKRLFMSSKTAHFMRWHIEERTDDGIMRHPADSPQWKKFDNDFPEFAAEHRNVRLGLASDGFNPFRTMSIAHSTWPVVLMPYNLPPWMCLTQAFLFLVVLIDGPKGPGNKIDVYLQPLIEELNELWSDGMITYDASKNQRFTLRAALLWTINDYPAYANLSGWSTKGRCACANCNHQTRSHWLKNGKKYCYLGHRRWLSRGHSFRRDKISFDGHREFEDKPLNLKQSDILTQLDGVLTEYKKNDLKKRKREECNRASDIHQIPGWKKKSIFFELPYWGSLQVRHSIDVMHQEKNVGENVLYTILGIAGKSKDGLKARKDLQVMGIRTVLHPQVLASGKTVFLPARFTMNKSQQDIFLRVLKSIKVPDGYASNISRCVHVKERNIWGLKSHDIHIIMQQFLPIAIRKALPIDVVKVIIELSSFYRQLCSKVNKLVDLKSLQERIVLTLCHLEKIFPPTFFDIMEHLTIHLAEEAAIAGPVQYRWMYPIERYLLTLKRYVRNRAHPEGSIAKGYLMEECMNFCERYLDGVETKSNRQSRNYDGGDVFGLPFKRGKKILLDEVTLTQMHRHVLFNTDGITTFLEYIFGTYLSLTFFVLIAIEVMFMMVEFIYRKHIESLKKELPRATKIQIDKVHNESFHLWFKQHVKSNDVNISGDIKHLSEGPSDWAWRYNGYFINGFRFRTKDTDSKRKTQNSGVMLKASTVSYASSKDKKPRIGGVTYYGRLTDIFQIQYTKDIKFILFKCDWIDPQVGTKVDEFNFTLVNFNHLLYKHNKLTDEPFILATQAEQVCYVQDPLELDWEVVMKLTLRDSFDMYSKNSSHVSQLVPQVEPLTQQQLDERLYTRDDDVHWVRDEVDGVLVDDAQIDIDNYSDNDIIED